MEEQAPTAHRWHLRQAMLGLYGGAVERVIRGDPHTLGRGHGDRTPSSRHCCTEPMPVGRTRGTRNAAKWPNHVLLRAPRPPSQLEMPFEGTFNIQLSVFFPPAKCIKLVRTSKNMTSSIIWRREKYEFIYIQMFQVRSEVTNSSRVKSVSKIRLLKGTEMCLLKWSRWIHKKVEKNQGWAACYGGSY